MRYFVLVVLWVVFGLSASAQSTLKFCGEVDKEGNCLQPSTDFAIDTAGGTITFQITNYQGLGATHITYKIYKLDDDGKETYISSVDQRTEKDWTFSWIDVVFFDQATYKVIAFDTSTENETLLCSSILKIFNIH